MSSEGVMVMSKARVESLECSTNLSIREDPLIFPIAPGRVG